LASDAIIHMGNGITGWSPKATLRQRTSEKSRKPTSGLKPLT